MLQDLMDKACFSPSPHEVHITSIASWHANASSTAQPGQEFADAPQEKGERWLREGTIYNIGFGANCSGPGRQTDRGSGGQGRLTPLLSCRELEVRCDFMRRNNLRASGIPEGSETGDTAKWMEVFLGETLNLPDHRTSVCPWDHLWWSFSAFRPSKVCWPRHEVRKIYGTKEEE